jgi:L-lactate dehydrogenase complex protein LldF
MPKIKDIFIDDSKIAFDKRHRKILNYNISKHYEAFERGKLRYLNLELAKECASFIKSEVVANLADYLEEFEKNALKNGIEVIWAKNGEEAVFEILRVLKENNARLLVKSKSMISEELDLNARIEKAGVEPVETDLGEFIVQVAGEKPYHILTPAMHKSKEDVAELFNEKFETPPNSTPEEITLFVRKKLRKIFTSAEIGITGANFLIADTGGIILTENEGNGFMSVSFPNVHIVISGIEKILPSVNDLPLFLPLLATHGTGQQVTVYNSLITGPKKPGETNGPEKMVVVLLDNKRTDIAQEKEQAQALKCIRCGACLNACPIYKNVGGYTYNTTYSGPIGSVISPYFEGFKNYNHLSFACTVCGACTEICPVKIPLHHLLLNNRRKSVEENEGSFSWNMGMKMYEFAFKKRKNLDFVSGNFKNTLLKLNPNILGKDKEFPLFAKQSFSRNKKLN